MELFENPFCSDRKERSFIILCQMISARKPFGINTDIFNNKSNYPEYKLNDKPYENLVLLWGVYGIKGGAKRITEYIDSNAIKKNR